MSGAAGPLLPDVFAKLLREAAVRRCLPLSPASADRLARYLSELDRWRRRVNLTGRLSAAELADHALESALGEASIPEGARVVDVGSGAGFPGIPLAIVREDLRMALLEPRGKRAEFLRHAVRAVPVGNAEVIQGRAKDLPDASFDAATVRAVGKVESLLAGARFLVPGGLLLLWTTRADDVWRAFPDLDRVEAIPDPAALRKSIAVLRKRK